MFCAWQFGGPRMLRSWRSEDYKRGEQPVLDELPVRLAYADRQGEAPRWPPRPYPPAEALLVEAGRLGSPPLGWARFLAPRPDLLADWLGLYTATVHGGVLPPRLRQLVRAEMARLLDCPSWAPPDSAALRDAGVGPRELAALAADDGAAFSPAEAAALAYTRAVVAEDEVADDIFATLAAQLDEGQIVQLGFAVAVQNGAIRVYRSLEQEALR